MTTKTSPLESKSGRGRAVSVLFVVGLIGLTVYFSLGSEMTLLPTAFMPAQEIAHYRSTDAGLVFSENSFRKPPPFPNLLVMGAEQGGVPELARMIASMTDHVCSPMEGNQTTTKVNYFSTSTDKNGKYKHGSNREGAKFYASHYQDDNCRNNQPYHLDATPNYFYMPDNIYSFYQQLTKMKPKEDVKLIVALREPVAREFEYFNFKADRCLQGEQTDGWCKGAVEFANNGERHATTFSKYIHDQVLDGCKYPHKVRPKWQWCRGHYTPYLNIWMNKFSRSNLLLLRYEDIVYSPDATMNRVKSFLGIPLDTPYKAVSFPSIKIPDISCQDQDTLQDVYATSNLNLVRMISEHPGPAVERNPFPKFKLSRCTP